MFALVSPTSPSARQPTKANIPTTRINTSDAKRVMTILLARRRTCLPRAHTRTRDTTDWPPGRGPRPTIRAPATERSAAARACTVPCNSRAARSRYPARHPAARRAAPSRAAARGGIVAGKPAMPKRKLEPDVLVLGDHPSAYLAAALLREGAAAPLRVCHAKIPGEAMPDRLCTINPALFDLHKLLAPLRKKLELTPVHGVKFLADDPNVRSEWTGKSPAAFVTTFKQVHAALAQVAADS